MPLRVDRRLPLAALAMLGGLMLGGAKPQPEPLPANGPAADYPVVVGEPFTIEGTTHTPVDKLNFDQVGQAIAGDEGGNGVSIAHKTLPLPSYAEVTSLDTGKTILVRVERRGPMRNDRLVELSPGAAAQLGVPGQAQVPIRIRRVNPPEVERAMLRAGGRAPDRMDTPQGLLVVLRRKLDPQVISPTSLPGAAPSLVPAPAAVPAPKPSVPVVQPVKPAPKAAPAPKPDAVPRVTPSPKPAPAPRAAPSPKPAVAPAPKPKPEANASAGGQFVVQVGSFSVEANAKAAAVKSGGRARPSGRLWRVQMGPFPSRQAAEAALAKARAAGYSDARIQRSD